MNQWPMHSQHTLLEQYNSFPEDTKEAIDDAMDVLLEQLSNMGFRITMLAPVDTLKAAIVRYVLETEQLVLVNIKS